MIVVEPADQFVHQLKGGFASGRRLDPDFEFARPFLVAPTGQLQHGIVIAQGVAECFENNRGLGIESLRALAFRSRTVGRQLWTWRAKWPIGPAGGCKVL